MRHNVIQASVLITRKGVNMENVVTAIFEVESAAYQAFTGIRQNPDGKGYTVAEAALIKRGDDGIKLLDSFDAGIYTTDDTAMGMLVGSIVGILGGPPGVLLGASTGALMGSVYDTSDAVTSASLIEITADKLYEGEVAIVALVVEDEEPAFDAAFEKFNATIMRRDALVVADEVNRAIETIDEMQNIARQQMRAERKAEISARYEERKAALKARYDALVAKIDERGAELDAKVDALDAKVDAKLDVLDAAISEANAQYESAQKEILGTE